MSREPGKNGGNPIRVLHLFSNTKWTGPAEPALNLCVALRRIGVEADFACSAVPSGEANTLIETARDRGIEPILRFRLGKHRNPLYNWLDRRLLSTFLAETSYDLIHCHMDNDHRIALKPANQHGIPLIRSSYYGTGFPDKSDCATLAKSAAHIIEPSQRAFEDDQAALGLPSERMTVIPNAVDTERFDPVRTVPDGRRWLHIPADAFVIGIVARMQTHRRYEDLFEAVRRLAEAYPQVHLLVVGRGTRQEQVAFTPVQEMGLSDRVHFSGYVSGENYVGMLKAFDVKVFLMPGSDGTCRAVREAMAMARPAVVADRGMLPEIVEDGVTGMVCDGSPEGLYNALAPLVTDPAQARTMGRAAREQAVRLFSLDTQAQAVRGVYESVLRVS